MGASLYVGKTSFSITCFSSKQIVLSYILKNMGVTLLQKMSPQGYSETICSENSLSSVGLHSGSQPLKKVPGSSKHSHSSGKHGR